MKKILIIIVIFAVAVVSVYSFIQSRKPVIAVSPSSYDFGIISQAKGKVSTEFTVKNDGNAPLKFNRVSTSCGCTTAEIDQSDLKAGESRKLNVTFDPQVHKDQYGPIVRVVYLQTNDPKTPELELQINANVTK